MRHTRMVRTLTHTTSGEEKSPIRAEVLVAEGRAEGAVVMEGELYT